MRLQRSSGRLGAGLGYHRPAGVYGLRQCATRHPGRGRVAGGDASGETGFWVVIPAGGAGSRLWPLSRATRPKFLLPLTGHRSLLQQTVDRLRPLAPPERTVVVCGPAHAPAIARQLPEIPEANLLVEPSPKGSPGDRP